MPPLIHWVGLNAVEVGTFDRLSWPLSRKVATSGALSWPYGENLASVSLKLDGFLCSLQTLLKSDAPFQRFYVTIPHPIAAKIEGSTRLPTLRQPKFSRKVSYTRHNQRLYWHRGGHLWSTELATVLNESHHWYTELAWMLLSWAFLIDWVGHCVD